MRIGIFGGSFDPVHFGHLLLAEWAREQAPLDEVWLMPAFHAPHKTRGHHTPGEARAKMLELACAGNKGLKVSRLELQRGGISFTAETLATIHRDRPDDELYLLMGADSLFDFPTWREPAQICQLATPLVARRFGEPDLDFTVLADIASAEVIDRAQRHQLLMPVVDFSSTEIRRRVQAGLSIRYQTPPAVIEYIAQHGLYQSNG